MKKRFPRSTISLIFVATLLFSLMVSTQLFPVYCQDCYRIWTDKNTYCVGEPVTIHWEDTCPYPLIYPPTNPTSYSISLEKPGGASQVLVQHGPPQGFISATAGLPVGQRRVSLMTVYSGPSTSSVQMVNQTTFEVIDCGLQPTLGPPPTMSPQEGMLAIISNVGNYNVFLNGGLVGIGDANGRSSLSVLPGNFAITLEKGGCQPASAFAVVYAGSNTEVTIPMSCQNPITPSTPPVPSPTQPPMLPLTQPPTIPPTSPPIQPPMQILTQPPQGGFSLGGNVMLFAFLGVIALLILVLLVVIIARR